MIRSLAILATVAATPSAASDVHARRPGVPVRLEGARPAPEPEALGTCNQRLQDGSFELGSGTPFGRRPRPTSARRSAASGPAGTAAVPRARGPDRGGRGSAGVDAFEQGSAAQLFTRPVSGTARLRFYLWIGARSGLGSDSLTVRVDGQAVFAVTDSTPGFGGYTLVERDISVFDAPGNHQIRFESTSFGAGPTSVTNFNVDDVSIEWCPLPTLTVSDPAPVAEGNVGGTATSFGVSLSQPSSLPVT